MQGNRERESETHILTDLIIKHVQQDDKSEFIHKMYIHDTVFQQHRPIQLVDQNITKKASEISRKKSKERTPILSDKYSIDNGHWYLSFPFTILLTLKQSVGI